MATTNLMLLPGTAPGGAHRVDPNGLYVTELIGFGVNGVTGDYSRGAVGLWIENGELAYPVEEVTIAGNLLEMFARIDGVGNDLVLRDRTVAPTLRISRMVVAGNLSLDAMIIDTHCHLHDAAFADVRETLRLSLTHDVWGAVAVGCDLETNAQTLAAAATAPKAVWPRWASTRPDPSHGRGSRIASRRRSAITSPGSWAWARSACPGTRWRGPRRRRRSWPVAASGSVGCWPSPRAGSAGRPCTRRTAPRPMALEALRATASSGPSSTGTRPSPEVTRAIVDAGYFVSVTPEVVYRERDRELVAAVPLDALLVESDAPWQYEGEFEGSSPRDRGWPAGSPRRSPRSSRLPVEDVMFQLSTNTCRLFDLIWV